MKDDKKLILSDSTLKSESKKLALKSNISTIPIVLGSMGAPFLFVLEQFIMMYAALGVISIGVVAMIINISFRTDAFKNVYLSQYNKKVEKEAQERREQLKQNLSTDSAVEQIASFERKYELFKESLNKELSTSSYSYQRLLGAFDQVYLLGLDKIEKIYDYEKNQSTIDIHRLLKEIKALKTKNSNEGLERHEEVKLKGLEERLELRAGYDGKISEILTQNELALTKMDMLQLNLTDLHKPKNMQIAMEELASLAAALNFEEKNAIRLDEE